MPRLHATATATVTLEISSASGWGPDCTIQQVHDQATSGAIGVLDRLLKGQIGIRIVGAPKLGKVTITEEP